MDPDERKRTYDGDIEEAPAPLGGYPKRSRPEDIMAGLRDDPTKATTRLLLNRNQFSRVIGKGGSTIAHIRTATGVYMKGTDIDDEYRLVVLNGSLEQVLNAFDMVTDLLHQALTPAEGGNAPPRNSEILMLHMLLEHSKAGKAVGTKGMMIQNIKIKSGALAIRIDKEPLEIHGITLRKLTIEGSLNSVRRAHLLVQELYVEPGASSGYGQAGALEQVQVQQQQPSPVNYGHGHGHRPSYSAGPVYDSHPQHQQQHQQQQQMMGQPMEQLRHPQPVPFPSLTTFGVQPETVRQLTEMKAYLWRHFCLDLTISKEMAPSAPLQHGGMGGGMQMGGMGRGVEQQMYAGAAPYGGGGGVGGGMSQRQMPMRDQRDRDRDQRGDRQDRDRDRGDNGGSRRPSHSNPTDVSFTIPKSCVGAVIGKGGQHLKDLQQEHGVRVYIEKEDMGGKRTVVLSYLGGDGTGMSEQDCLLRCQQHIESMVADQVVKQKQADAQYAADNAINE